MATLIMEQHETSDQNGNICNEDHLIEVKNTDESNTKNTNNEDKVIVDSHLHLKIKMNFVKDKISPTKLPNFSSSIPQSEKHENNNNNNTENGNNEIVTTPTLPPKKKRTKQARNNLLEEAESFMQNSKVGTKRSTVSSRFAGARGEDLVSLAMHHFEELDKEQELWERTTKYLANESERERKLQESRAYWRSVAQSKKRKQSDLVWLDKKLEEPGDTLVVFDSRTFFACLQQNAKRAAWEALQSSKLEQKNAEQNKKTKKS